MSLRTAGCVEQSRREDEVEKENNYEKQGPTYTRQHTCLPLGDSFNMHSQQLLKLFALVS